jgi:hypothetical protein
MVNGGKDKAAWNTSSGKHTMTYTAAVTHLPVKKPEVVVGQYHDAQDDCMEVGLRKDKLIVFHDSTVYGTLDGSYELGKKFTIKIEVENDTTFVYYNDLTKASLSFPTKYNGCYFKCGCYTQSSTEKGDSPMAYAEVLVYDLKVEHS